MSEITMKKKKTLSGKPSVSSKDWKDTSHNPKIDITFDVLNKEKTIKTHFVITTDAKTLASYVSNNMAMSGFDLVQGIRNFCKSKI